MVTLRSKVRFARMHHTSLGFTLVELLVVIAIIALLLAILMPVLGAARESGRTIVCGQRLRQQHLAHVMYAQENNDTFFQSWLWFREMIAYKRQKGDMSYALLKCPTSLGSSYVAGGPYSYWRSGYDWADPPYVEGGHAFNSVMNGIALVGSNGTKLSKHKFLDKTAVAIDSWNCYWNIQSGSGGYTANLVVSYRHKKRNIANVVFLDGHTVGEKKSKNWLATELYYNFPKD